MVINLRKVAFKVHMVSGKLSRYKWVRNRVSIGDIVEDKDSRRFKVQKVTMVPDPSMELTTLKILYKADSTKTRKGKVDAKA